MGGATERDQSHLPPLSRNSVTSHTSRHIIREPCVFARELVWVGMGDMDEAEGGGRAETQLGFVGVTSPLP